MKIVYIIVNSYFSCTFSMRLILPSIFLLVLCSEKKKVIGVNYADLKQFVLSFKYRTYVKTDRRATNVLSGSSPFFLILLQKIKV